MPPLEPIAGPALDASPPAEQRRHDRHLCIDGDALRLAVRPSFRGRRALLVDLSAGGLGFLLDGPLEAGAVLAVDLCGEEGGVGRLARVRHCRPHPVPANAPWLPRPSAFAWCFRRLFGLTDPPPPGQAWLVGCEFTRPLEAGELKELLGLLGSSAAREIPPRAPDGPASGATDASGKGGAT